MSVKHIAWVFDNTDLRGTDRLMMLAIADYADEVGSCFPSYRRLAEKCNITRRNAINAINRLVDSGHIGIRQYAGIETQNGNTNRFYMLKWRAENSIDNSEFTSDATDTSVATDTPTSVATDTPTSVATDTLTVGNRSLTVDAPNGDARPRKRDEVFDWIAENIYQQRADKTIPKSVGGRIAKTKRAIREIHTVNGTDLTIAHLDKFRQWWLRAYSGLTMPRSTEKLSEYYNQFYQSSQKSSPAQQQQPDLTVQAQIELGYDTITPNLMNDEIREYLETMTPWT